MIKHAPAWLVLWICAHAAATTAPSIGSPPLPSGSAPFARAHATAWVDDTATVEDSLPPSPPQGSNSPEDWYAQLRFGFLSLGGEVGLASKDREKSYFALCESEGFLFVGQWYNIMVGGKRALYKGLFAKAGLGWQIDQAISGNKSGAILSVVLVWQTQSPWLWAFEISGMTVALTPLARWLAPGLHVPKVTVTYFWD